MSCALMPQERRVTMRDNPLPQTLSWPGSSVQAAILLLVQAGLTPPTPYIFRPSDAPGLDICSFFLQNYLFIVVFYFCIPRPANPFYWGGGTLSRRKP